MSAPQTTAQMLDELDGYAEKLGATAVAYARNLRRSAPNDRILASIVSGFRQQAEVAAAEQRRLDQIVAVCGCECGRCGCGQFITTARLAAQEGPS